MIAVTAITLYTLIKLHLFFMFMFHLNKKKKYSDNCERELGNLCIIISYKLKNGIWGCESVVSMVYEQSIISTSPICGLQLRLFYDDQIILLLGQCPNH